MSDQKQDVNIPFIKNHTAHARLGSNDTVYCHIVQIQDDLAYSGTNANSNNDVSLKIRQRMFLVHWCYFGLSRRMSNKILSRMPNYSCIGCNRVCGRKTANTNGLKAGIDDQEDFIMRLLGLRNCFHNTKFVPLLPAIRPPVV